VRPAPLDCDISASEESEEESEESDDDLTTDANNKSNRKQRNKAIQKYLRKFRTKVSDNLSLERDVVVPVMGYLSPNDLLNCMRVCKAWNGMLF
jgi:hypothetical protein